MMRIAVIANDALKDELLANGMQDKTSVTWLTEPLPVTGADCYIDLLFQPEPVRIDTLTKLSPALILINDVSKYPGKLPENFIRINGWDSLLKRTLVEAASENTSARAVTEKVFSQFNKSVEWTPDQPGFITARVITMIINEAYFALGENVSSRQDIDIAMKAGTNYPFGPFEWSQRIGLKKIYDLLISLSQHNSRYTPAPLLAKEALNQ